MKAERLRLKYLTSRPSGDACASSVDDFISLDGVESWTGKRVPIDGGDRDLSGTPCRAGDLLFGKLRPYLAKVHLVETDAVCASEFISMRPRKGSESRFLRYALSTEDFVRLVNSMSYGTKMPRVDPADFLDIKLAVPPEPLQARIADYLDSETARIDTLIDRKQRFIDLLLEKRTALITHAVTKGLDPNVEMKDSGFPWFGDIPTGWPLVRLGYFAKVINGSTPSRNEPGYWADGTVPWMSSGKVNEDRISEASELITERALRECSISLIPAGSVVVGLVGQGRTRGTASLLDVDATINQNMAAIISRGGVDGRYLQYQLTNMYLAIREYGRGGNQAALNCELVADLRLPLPPLAEQQAIATFLDEEIAKLEKVAARTRCSIELLREYRTALISAAVTGQIDVPGTETTEEVA